MAEDDLHNSKLEGQDIIPDTSFDALPELDQEPPEDNTTPYNLSGTLSQKEQLKLTELAAQGLAVAGITGASETREERADKKRKKQSSTSELIIQKQMNDIAQKIAENAERITFLENENKEILERIEGLEKEQAFIQSVCKDIKRGINELTAAIESNEQRFKAIAAEMHPDTQKALGAYTAAGENVVTIPIGDGGKRYVVHQNENGDYFYEKDGENIVITDSDNLLRIQHQLQGNEKLGNDLSPEDLERFEAAQTAFRASIDKHGEAGYSDTLGKLFADKELMEIKVENLEKGLAARQARSAEIDHEIAELRTQYDTNIAEIQNLEREQEQLKTEWKELNTQADALKIQQTQINTDYNAALALFTKEKAETVIAERNFEELNTVFSNPEYGDRHSFLIHNMQGGIDTFHENLVRHNGEIVYHDYNATNPTEKLFTLNADTQERTYITDVTAVTTLMNAAYTEGAPQSFGNESRHPDANKDEKLTFEAARNADYKTKNDIKAVEQGVEIQRAEEKSAHIEMCKSAADEIDPDGGINAQKCSPGFNTASAPPETPETQLGVTFAPINVAP